MNFNPAQLKLVLGKIIADVHAIHNGAPGELRMAELAALMNLPLDATMHRLLVERGAIKFVPCHPLSASPAAAPVDVTLRDPNQPAPATPPPTLPNEGRFENRGAEIRVPTDMATIIFPPLIAGAYLTTPQILDIRFNPNATIFGKKMMFSAPVESLHMRPDQLDVKVGGPMGPMLSRTVKTG